jgi:RimJ/RimL family protein N-acetyltransferase
VDCRIRSYETEDAEALWEAVRESVTDLSPWLPWCDASYSLADATKWATEHARPAAAGHELAFAIVGPSGEYLGGCGINQINSIHRFGNLGYWVRTTATGRGVATSAVRQVAEFAFRATDLVRLEIVCALGNVRSQRVAERAGATREGVLRNRLLIRGKRLDAVMYSLVRQA